MNVWGVTFRGYFAKIFSFKSGNLLYKSKFYLLSEPTVSWKMPSQICILSASVSYLWNGNCSSLSCRWREGRVRGGEGRGLGQSSRVFHLGRPLFGDGGLGVGRGRWLTYSSSTPTRPCRGPRCWGHGAGSGSPSRHRKGFCGQGLALLKAVLSPK